MTLFPVTKEDFTAENGVTYTWEDNRWRNWQYTSWTRASWMSMCR